MVVLIKDLNREDMLIESDGYGKITVEHYGIKNFEIEEKVDY